ncbi:cytosine permease [Kitasatospora atroaurantiaca]|uniref:Purine-cytosine permease-like protein n=1 Tax=Kitasatospora atroaurantiaca TaxID=285545 RepID=A0A561EY10_9ACTN|nr:cytosine permease [Kitasatospora atroaurantiaca]TWE20498.1 purine-cytosine permease-like protein [Kitasatospora atroaurantiaca]
MTTAPTRGDDGTSVSDPADLNADITAYGSHVLAVEPTGAEPIPEEARHGSPLGLLWTWLSPNMEFATIYIGVISVLFFGLGFWTASAALLLGTAVGSVTHGWLSAYGPRFGVPQMVAGRVAFGRWGNALPAGLNAVGAGLGWFAVNSVSGAFALSTLSGMPTLFCLVLVVIAQIAVAYLGHNFVHGFEKYALPLLTVVFLAASAVTLGKAHLGGAAGTAGGFGGFMLAFSTAFGYAAGWNPFAADYTRYLPSTAPRWKVITYPAVGVFVGVSVLAVVGAASATIVSGEKNPTAAFTGHLPGWLGNLTLLAIMLGAISANAINIYSAGMSFVSLGLRRLPRGPVALVIGLLGFLVAWSGLSDAGHSYEAFLLVIAYWVAPWLAVVFVDQWLRHRAGGTDEAAGERMADASYEVWAGPVSMLAGTLVSVLLFSNQEQFTGYVAKAAPSIGDLTCVVGFVLTALLYAGLRRVPGLAPSR